ncbi:MAG: cobalt-precorrin-5B (C(1))-methyltransferase, partial [Peptococcaceae bacterium]|nr:cobalt-precorrin-5B (C(1))-methyltransferase [Peptococcaceae bacterium]
MERNCRNPGEKKKELRCGVTTGASAAAAAKAAALLYFRGEKKDLVTVVNPRGDVIKVPVKKAEYTDGGAMAAVVKDGGDDPDVTSGLEIIAEITPAGGGI